MNNILIIYLIAVPLMMVLGFYQGWNEANVSKFRAGLRGMLHMFFGVLLLSALAAGLAWIGFI